MPGVPWDYELRSGVPTRRNVFANTLPSNAGTELNAETGMPVSGEENIPGWTVQHPNGFRRYTVGVLYCVLCGVGMDPNALAGHDCPVRAATA